MLSRVLKVQRQAAQRAERQIREIKLKAKRERRIAAIAGAPVYDVFVVSPAIAPLCRSSTW
jgi:uncharacterized membrane protein